MADGVRLCDLPVRVRADVQHVLGPPALRRRLLSLGLTPGSPLQILRRMPLGGPIELEVRGTLLALRRQDACAVRVRARTHREDR